MEHNICTVVGRPHHGREYRGCGVMFLCLVPFADHTLIELSIVNL